jgi:hypothetical protein
MAGPWISIIALGALMGFLGQAIRVIVGLKKTKDQAAALQQAFTEMFEPSTLLISLLIGVVAGVLAALMTLKPEAAISPETLLGLAAAGYSGADFIEGFVSRYLPSGAVQAAAPQLATTTPLPGPPAPLPAPGPMTSLARGPAPVTPLPPPAPSGPAPSGG